MNLFLNSDDRIRARQNILERSALLVVEKLITIQMRYCATPCLELL